MRRILALVLVLLLVMPLGINAKSTAFSDVPSTAWFAKDVQAATDLGLIKGKGNGKFDPNGNLTFAEVIMLAVRVRNKYEGTTFESSGGEKWYTKAVEYATSKGILTETYETNYEKLVTRQDMAVIFALTLPEKEYAPIESNSYFRIPDVPTRGSYEESLVRGLYCSGILIGTGTSRAFNPKQNITRAEVATILNRLVTKSKRVTFPAPADIVGDSWDAVFAYNKEHANASQIPAFKEKNTIMHAEDVQVDFSSIKPLKYYNAFLEVEFIAYPIKPIAEALGFIVSSDAENNNLTFVGHDNIISLTIYGSSVTWNGSTASLRDNVRVRNGSTYLTERDVSDLFGLVWKTNIDGSVNLTQTTNYYGEKSFSGDISSTVDKDKDGLFDFINDKNIMYSGDGGIIWDFIPEDFSNGITINWKEREQGSF